MLGSWGGGLTKAEKLKVVDFLEGHKADFAYSTADLGGFTGAPMEIPLTTNHPIFSHAYKLGKTDWDFVGENCSKLKQQGLIRPSHQSKYASATVVVRKRDEDGAYTDLRQCGDYRPINGYTDLNRYPLLAIEDLFREQHGAVIFSKLDLKYGYH